MKKLIAFLTIAGFLTFGLTNFVSAQAKTAEPQTTETTQDSPEVDEALAVSQGQVDANDETHEDRPFRQVLKDKYIEGTVMWMTPLLLILIFGLAMVIERIIYLNLATTNTKKLLAGIEETLSKGDLEAAKELCRNTRGPVASIFYQGLERYNEGIEEIDKAVVAYGGVQTARLESNMTWIGFCIAVAPSLGFMTTVIGMVKAFDDIEKAGNISPTIVAGGMKLALITTIFGLIIAVILQLFYSYLMAKVDSLVTDMEDSTINYMDIIVRYKE